MTPPVILSWMTRTIIDDCKPRDPRGTCQCVLQLESQSRNLRKGRVSKRTGPLPAQAAPMAKSQPSAQRPEHELQGSCLRMARNLRRAAQAHRAADLRRAAHSEVWRSAHRRLHSRRHQAKHNKAKAHPARMRAHNTRAKSGGVGLSAARVRHPRAPLQISNVETSAATRAASSTAVGIATAHADSSGLEVSGITDKATATAEASADIASRADAANAVVAECLRCSLNDSVGGLPTTVPGEQVDEAAAAAIAAATLVGGCPRRSLGVSVGGLATAAPGAPIAEAMVTAVAVAAGLRRERGERAEGSSQRGAAAAEGCPTCS
eukprot:CAMPEP_0204194528 /NCGR_PEP_ID=MMETSP0361-20130328/62430_1 /ASSEMBLY_ACC=CAM_ASM_000343 /TAXON_ID=268821 /ORGANISM="Scrippsiella Hangoei, Strain SHTV-5" /LENGTH=320 /DNA_ID=CAMNT_0051155919 /DNA_START=300 /DNA_END=1260 /DNA_ORIENTATION=+